MLIPPNQNAVESHELISSSKSVLFGTIDGLYDLVLFHSSGALFVEEFVTATSPVYAVGVLSVSGTYQV